MNKRPLFDENLSEEEVDLLSYLQKRGALRSEAGILRDRRGKHPRTKDTLDGLNGVWIERTLWKSEPSWRLLDWVRVSRILRARGRERGHHRHQTRFRL